MEELTVPLSTIDRHSEAQISSLARELLQQAKASIDGIGGVTLETYPGHMTMLSVRVQSGGAELHQDRSDIFLVVEGQATVITGGTLIDATEIAPGETRGSRIADGLETPMLKGDVIHIGPSVPHQIVVTPGTPFTYYVIKVAVP